MTLSQTDLIHLTETAIHAAQTAGQHISETRPINVQRKEGGNCIASQVVTEVDQQAQDIILQILNPTLAPFELALLTEESADDGERLEKDYFWCIDPIDGTLPFIENIPGYAVSIALVASDGSPQIGVIFDPVEQTLYHAIKGQGAFRNRIPWKTNPTPAGAPLSMITDRSFAEQECYPLVLEELKRISKELGFNGVKATTHGGGVMNACWVLENPPACYFKFPKPQDGGGSSWDFAATACIFHELGALVTDIHGAPLDLNRPDSTFMNHRGTLFATHSTLAPLIRTLHTKLNPS